MTRSCSSRVTCGRRPSFRPLEKNAMSHRGGCRRWRSIWEGCWRRDLRTARPKGLRARCQCPPGTPPDQPEPPGDPFIPVACWSATWYAVDGLVAGATGLLVAEALDVAFTRGWVSGNSSGRSPILAVGAAFVDLTPAWLKEVGRRQFRHWRQGRPVRRHGDRPGRPLRGHRAGCAHAAYPRPPSSGCWACWPGRPTHARRSLAHRPDPAGRRLGRAP